MTPSEELKQKFESLSNEDKLLFMKSIMPSFCEAFRNNPQNMMRFCQDIMKSCGMDMQSMNPGRG